MEFLPPRVLLWYFTTTISLNDIVCFNDISFNDIVSSSIVRQSEGGSVKSEVNEYFKIHQRRDAACCVSTL